MVRFHCWAAIAGCNIRRRLTGRGAIAGCHGKARWQDAMAMMGVIVRCHCCMLAMWYLEDHPS